MSSSQRERIAHRERNPRRSQPGPTIDLTEDLLRPVKSTPRNNVRKSGFVKGNVIDLLSDDEDEAEPVRPKPPGQKAAATAKPATKRKPRPQPRPSGGVIDLNTPSRSPSPATRSENAKIPVKEKTGPSPKQHSSPAAPKSSARKSALNTSTPKASSSSSGLKATLPKKPVPFVPPPPGETDDDSSGSPLPELERVATLIKTSPQSAKKQNTTGEALIAPIPSPFLPKPPSTLPSAGDDDDPSANLPALEPPLPTPNGATASTNPSPKPAEKTDTQQKSVAATKKRSSAPFIVPNFEDSREEFSDDDVPPLEPPPAVPKSTLKAFPRFARPKAQTRSSQKDAATFVVSNFDDFEGGFSDDDVPPLKPSLPKEKPKPKNSPQSARKQKARTPGPAAQSIRRSPSADSVLQDAPPELPDSPEREVDMEDAAEEQRYIEDYNHPRSPSSFPSSKAPVPEDDEDEDDEYVDDVSLDRPVTLDVPLRSLRGRRSPEKSNASTVDSTSPLITRIRQQKEKTEAFRNHVTAQASTEGADAGESSKTQPRRNTSKRDLEEALSQYFEEMKEEHAVMTRYMLQDAQKAVQMAKPIAVDKVSPFAAMLPVNSSPGDPITGATTNKLYSYTAQKQTTKLLKTTTILNAKTISRNTPRVPRYNSHINIRRNILREDDEKLKFIPFLGEAEGGARRETNFKRLVKELEDAYSPRNSSSSRQSEEAARIRSYLDDWLEELDIQCDQQTLKHYLITQDQYSDELGLHPHNRKRLLKFFGPPSSIDKLNAARMFNEAFDVTSDINLQDVLLPSALLKEMIEALAKTTDIIHDRLGTHTELICLICGAVDCQTHGDYGQEDVELSSLSDDEDPDDRPQETKYVPHPITLDYKNTIRRHRAQLRALPDAAKMSKQRPCTEACYTVFDFSCMEYEWHEDQFAMLPDLMLSWAKTSAQACFIAYEMNVPCWTVYAEIQKYKKEHGGLPEDDDDDDDQIPTGRPEKPNWYDNKRKVLKSEWSDNTKAHLHQERTQAVPCGHRGPCTSTCTCVISNILCERFCACSDCPRKFTGCSCQGYGLTCTSDSCICIQMNRECGPECISCGALERIDPLNKYDDTLFSSGCQNVYLQRGVSKAMVMGESQLVGFGLYLAQAVKKGDFISEYAGEVVSSEEAERRGIIYDRKFLSFLFDLNRERVIDAARLGNLTRFINHAGSPADGLNCEAKIFLVNGEHRIKFVALRDIDVSEELLFNYGKKFAEKQGLTKTLPKVKVGAKRGVLEGEDVDALDGVSEGKRGVRGKMNAIRGGHGQGKGRGGRMRKSAAKVVPVVEKEDEDDGDEFAGEEDYDDEQDNDGRSGRRKRKITRPARYTR